VFHPGQWEAIEALVAGRKRLLVVERTGWGKSIVYFIATRLLRDRGAGCTLLISPLLALMRNQIAAAKRIGFARKPSTRRTRTIGRRLRRRCRPARSTFCRFRPRGWRTSSL
jgi:superfamily II DNA helicase RecQ